MVPEVSPEWKHAKSGAEWSRESAHRTLTLLANVAEDPQEPEHGTGSRGNIWLNPGLKEEESTANLDNQPPATLFYLGLVKDISEVVRVYVEELGEGRRKHWSILSERDYEAMDKIYDIEETTLNRFPTADIDFRVTIETEDGPSISSQATLIYDVT